MDYEETKLPCYKTEHLVPGQTKYRYLVPLFTCMTFVIQFDESTYNLAIPHIMEDLEISSSDAEWLITAFFLGTAAFSVPFSKVGAQVGYVKLTAILMSIAFVLYVVSYFCTNFPLLACIRFVIGCVTAGIHSIRNSIASLYVPSDYTQESIKNTLVIKQTLLAIAPFLGSLLIEAFGWRIILVVPSVFCIVTVICLIPMSDLKANTKHKFDVAGTAVLAFMLTTFDMTFTCLSEGQWLGAAIMAFSVGSSMFLYAQIEDVFSNPITPLWILRRPISIILVLNFFNYMLQNACSFVFPMVLDKYGYSSSTEGLISSAACCCGIISTLIANEVTKKVTYHFTLTIFYCFASVVLLITVFLFDFSIGTVCMFIICDFAAFLLAETTYGEVLIASPHSITPIVAGFPTSTRMIGSSVAYSLSSCLYDVFSKTIDYEFSGEVSVIVCEMLFCLFNVIVCQLWLGNGEFERGRIAFREKEVVDVRFPPGFVSETDSFLSASHSHPNSGNREDRADLEDLADE